MGEMGEMEDVRIVSKQMIEPAEQPAESFIGKSISLSLYDKVMRFALYQKRILFYNPVAIESSNDEYAALLQSLKSSLARVLVSFYPLAGRLSSGGDQIDVSTLSVQFLEAVTDARLVELARNGGIRPSSFCDKLCEMGCSPKWPWSPDLPLLFAQVTRFADGGISIAIAFSHQVCDGVSGWHFFNSWAQITRDGILKHPPVVSYSVEEQDMSNDEVFKVASTIGYKIRKETTHPEDLKKLMEKYNSSKQLVTKLFSLKQRHISSLKSKCFDETGVNFSTYVLVCGYFWRQTAIARRLDPDQVAQIAVLFDSRGKFAKVPKFYLGNAIASAIVTARAEDLMTSKSLGYAAGVLHKAIVGMDEKKNQAQLKFMDQVIKTGFIAQMEIDPTAFSLVVSSPRHPVYDTDFGFGKPIGVTLGENDLNDGKIYLFPTASGDGVDVTVVLNPPAMERLEIDVLSD